MSENENENENGDGIERKYERGGCEAEVTKVKTKTKN